MMKGNLQFRRGEGESANRSVRGWKKQEPETEQPH